MMNSMTQPANAYQAGAPVMTQGNASTYAFDSPNTIAGKQQVQYNAQGIPIEGAYFLHLVLFLAFYRSTLSLS